MRRAHGAVLVAGVLFGSTFAVMKDAVANVEPVPFIAVRFLVGGLVLAPFAWRGRRQAGVTRAGVLCGLALLIGYVFQTVGLQYTTSSVSAFITYLLIVMVPVIAAATMRKLPSAPTAAGVVLATGGLFLLTGHGVALGKGELLTLGGAVSFAVHILLLSELSPNFATTTLTSIQLLFVGATAGIAGFALGGYAFPLRVWIATIYTGVAVSAIALALQVWGQRQIGPTRTALLLMIEPVAAALLGYTVGDRLGAAGVAGAVLILAGIATAEIPTILTDRSTG